MPLDHDNTSPILFDIIDMLERDRRSGSLFGLAHYLARFPGHDEIVAREYLQLLGSPPPAALPQEPKAIFAESAPPQHDSVAGFLKSSETSFDERLRRLAAPILRGTHFQREEEMARGGMGVIHRVRDIELDRTLAVKEMILGPASEHALDSARFLEEAQVTAQLDHPGIVPIHEVGMNAAGHLYFAMKLVRGRDLRTILDLTREGREGWTQTRILGVLLKVCEAMAYAHSKGVIHRDLKPANLMVGHFGEVYVMDWGLARAMGRQDLHDIRLKPGHVTESLRTERREEREGTPDSPLVTMDGVVVGTPAYMSPEQARGEIHLLSPRCDVYSLGAMLYHLLAGQIPYVPPGARLSQHTVLARVIEGPPRPVHEFAPDASQELVAICEKAMARDPARRYADMHALREDLRAYLEGRVVKAHESGPIAELSKWVRRNKGLAATGAIAVLALIVGLIVSLWLREEATRRADEVLRLAAVQKLDDLVREADTLWPAHPENIGNYETWLLRAEELMSELPQHEVNLIELRARAQPWTEAQQAAHRASHPRLPELEATRRRLEFLRKRTARLFSTSPEQEPTPEEVGVDFSLLPQDPIGLNTVGWALVNPDRGQPGFEEQGLVILRRAVSLPSSSEERARTLDSLAWALFACGRFEEAVAEKQAAVEAGSGSLQALRNRIDRDQSAEGRAKAAQELASVERALTQIEAELSARPESAWAFDSREDRRLHNQLMKLVDGLKAFADPATGLLSADTTEEHGWGIRKRLEFARGIAERTVSGEPARTRWLEAIASIGDPVACPRYEGLRITPQVGLLPIGRDLHSGLWEFAHLQTGEPAERDADGRLTLREETGLVLVLLPGGTFWMGAQKRSRELKNFDPSSTTDEFPVHPVTLSPFFLSKYEMTQAQWLRFAGQNPSNYNPRNEGSLLNPVEQVSWTMCRLERLGLMLPSEAQWEYGARGGTSSVWWTGNERDSLRGAVNLADATAKAYGVAWVEVQDWPELVDGAVVHAPVDHYLANPFGLHNVYGNVSEWCQDGFDRSYYTLSSLRPPGSGPARDPCNGPESYGLRVSRGGSFRDTSGAARSADRQYGQPEDTSFGLGLRPARRVLP